MKAYTSHTPENVSQSSLNGGRNRRLTPLYSSILFSGLFPLFMLIMRSIFPSLWIYHVLLEANFGNEIPPLKFNIKYACPYEYHNNCYASFIVSAQNYLCVKISNHRDGKKKVFRSFWWLIIGSHIRSLISALEDREDANGSRKWKFKQPRFFFPSSKRRRRKKTMHVHFDKWRQVQMWALESRGSRVKMAGDLHCVCIYAWVCAAFSNNKQFSFFFECRNFGCHSARVCVWMPVYASVW